MTGCTRRSRPPALVVLLLLAITPVLPVFGQAAEPVRVTGELQAWADANRDGILQPREIDVLIDAALRLLAQPHPASSPLDALFDSNHDGKIGLDEVERAWNELIPRLVHLALVNPEAARQIDVDDSGAVSDDEALLVLHYLSRDRAAMEPHRASSPLDGRIDANRDGRISAEEIAGFRERIVRAAMIVPLGGGAAGPEEIRVAGSLDELADLDGNGLLSPEERRLREAGLRGPHVAETAFDRRLDADRNGKVEQGEIDRVLQAEEPRVAERAVEQPSEKAVVAAAEPKAAISTPAPQTTTAQTLAATPATATAPAAAPGAKVTLEKVEIDEIFPVFRSYYDDHPIGSATLKNGESVALEDLKVELELKGYMDAKKPCTAAAKLEAGAEQRIDLTAVFNDNVLKLTEGTKALATVTVSGTMGGQAVSKDFVQTVQFLKVNAMTWDDDDRAAAFVTANDPLVQQFRSAVVTNVDKAVTAVDLKLRTAMALHQALVKYGLKYWTDPNAAYETVTKTKSAVDSLQFPVQTIQLKTGDCDDLAILACAILESASVETAFITVPGHIFVAFALGMKPDDARATFSKLGDIIFEVDKAWIPYEVTELSGGFLKAWETGAKEWTEAKAKNLAALRPVHEAWKKYKPVAYSAAQVAVTLPAESEWTKAYTEEVKTFINRQIAARVSELQADIKKNPTKPESMNKLGVLYAKYGLAAEAEAEFLKLEKQNYVPALLNLGNLAFLAGDMKKALGYYDRALQKEAANPRALLGVARANHELENYGNVLEAYGKLKTVDATLAAQFAYLELKGTEAARAAAVGQVKGVVVWEEK